VTDGVTYDLWIRAYGPAGMSTDGANSGWFQAASVAIDIPKPVVTAPTGTVTTGVGNPTYTWDAAAGATSYELYVGPAGGGQVFYETISPTTEYIVDTPVCDAGVCSVDATVIDASYVLPANGDYVIWIRADFDGTFGDWQGPTPFTLAIADIPGAPTNGAVSELFTLRPTFTWDVGDAEEASYFRLALVDSSNATILSQWFTRAELCGSYAGTSCSFTVPNALTNGETYTLFAQPYGPAGLNTTDGTGGYVEVASGTISIP
jgi:hypothetical protein